MDLRASSIKSDIVHRLRRPFPQRAVLVVFVSLSSLTCHVSDVTGPATVRDIQLAISGDSVVVMGAQALAVVRATSAGKPVTRPRIQLVSSDTMILAVSADGDSVVGRALGTATLTAQLQNSLFPDPPPSTSRIVRVVPRHLAIVPASVQFQSLGDTLPVSVIAYDAHDEVIGPVKASFSVANTALATVVNSRVASVAVGTTELRAAMIGVDTVRAPIIVGQTLQRFVFPAPIVTLDAIGADTTLVAVGLDARGNAIPGAVPTFGSTDSARVRVTQTGLVRALANGAAYVMAFRGDGLADSVRVVVNQRATRVLVSPVTTTSISSQFGQIRLAAFAYDRLGQTVTDDVPIWRSNDERIVTVDTGRVATVTGRARGDAYVVAQQDNARDSVLVTVINDPVSIDLTPESATLLTAHDSLPLKTIIKNGEGGIIDTVDYTITSSDSSVLRVLSNSWAMAVDTGRVRLIARTQSAAGPLADTSFIDVLNLPDTLRMLASVDTLTYIGDTLTAPVSIANRRGEQLARSRVAWVARAPAIASVTSTGRITANTVGSTWVVATAGALRDSIRVVVTNLVASVAINGIADGAVDTIPAIGVSIPYTATVWGTSGSALPQYRTTWTSTSPGVATVDGAGVVTSTSFGAASIIVRAGAATDTVRLLVRKPSRWHVDNVRAGNPALGTLGRPFPTIGTGVSRASDGDTVIVAAGSRYAETISVPLRLTILGDSAAFVANGRDPSRLPVLSHESGAAAIAVSTGPFVVRYLSIVHVVPGAAIAVSGADATISSVFVNPGRVDAPLGSGFLIQNAPLNARIDSVRIESVRGYGVRMVNAAGARVMRTRIMNVVTDAGGAPVSGEDGAGIALIGGRGAVLTRNVVTTTDGPQITLAGTTDGSLTYNTLSGERQLARLSSVVGITTVSDNDFDLARVAGDAYTGTSVTDGRSGLEVAASAGVQIERNTFRTSAGVASLMDAIHVADTRATRLDGNHFHGGRRAVRSERSAWDMLRSRTDSVAVGIESLGGDSITFSDDTLVNASVGCISQRNGFADLQRVVMTQCGVGDAPALGVIGGTLTVDALDVRGTNPRAVRADSARVVRLRRSIVRGPLAGTVGVGGLAGVDLSADSVTVTASLVTGYPDRASVYVTGTTVRVDSTTANRSQTGIIVGGAPSAIDVRDNDIADNSLAGLSMRAGALVAAPGTWWGDDRGPAGTSGATLGDTIVGPVLASPYRATPLRPGSVAALLVLLRGNGQIGPQQTTLPLPFSVRLVDADGLPVKGVAVKFTIPNNSNATFTNNLKTVNVISNDSGIAEATMKLPKQFSFTVVSVTAPGATNTVSFTAIGQ